MLVKFLKDPSIVEKFSISQWQLLINQGRISNLLGRCYFLLKKNELLNKVPQDILWHFESAYKIAQRQRYATHHEIELINNALAQKNIIPTFLKGAAYCVLEIDCSFGRVFSDIDVLVNKNELQTAETQFFINGWLRMKIDDYDDQYYRMWMHEIPPLRHCKRASVVDLHHNLMPLTNKHVPKIEQLSVQNTINKWSTDIINVLSKTDIIIHSSIHLFTEGEFEHGLRDLSDLDMMIREFSLAEENFVDKLINRANELGLAYYLWFALRYTALVFSTPVASISKLNSENRSKLSLNILDFCYLQVFKPNHSSCKTWKTPIANFILYWRGHLIRMPLRLLIPHLARKTWMGFKDFLRKDNNPEEKMIP